MRVFLESKINWTITIISVALFLLFLFFVLPWMSAYTTRVIEVAEAPDTMLFYSAESFYEVVDAYGEEGRKTYVRLRWSFDLLWPLVYLSFLLSLMIQLTRGYRLHWVGQLFWLPIVAAGFDYLENTLASLLMVVYPMRLERLATMASVTSSLKWLVISIAFVMVLLLLLRRLWQVITQSL